MRAAVAISLKLFFVLFFLVASAAGQSAPAINDPQSWLRSGWDNLAAAEDVDQQEKPLKSNCYAIHCEQHNFDLFFILFSEDKYFQESTIIFPLKLTTSLFKKGVTEEDLLKGDDYIISQKFLIKKKEGDGINIFPNRHQRAIGNFTYSIESESPQYGMNSVVLRREGTGIHYTFIFIWKDCWLLSEVINNST